MDTKTLQIYAAEKWDEIIKVFIAEVDVDAAGKKMDAAIYWWPDAPDVPTQPMMDAAYYRPGMDPVGEPTIIVFSERNWKHALIHEMAHHLQDLLGMELDYSAIGFGDYYMQEIESQAEWAACEIIEKEEEN